MRLLLLLPLLSIAGWFEGVTLEKVNAPPADAPPADLQLIDQLDECLQARFQAPDPPALGMSRVAMPVSFGQHFMPNLLTQTDFGPGDAAEHKLVAELEGRHLQIGFYLTGRSIASAPEVAPTMPPAYLEALGFYSYPPHYRTLKGPAVVTAGTPRPAWYPGYPGPRTVAPDALPDWEEIYAMARKAMRSFDDGAQGFETSHDSWQIAARPVVASQDRCVACHNNPGVGGAGTVKLNHAIGGIIYAYRRVS